MTLNGLAVLAVSSNSTADYSLLNVCLYSVSKQSETLNYST